MVLMLHSMLLLGLASNNSADYEERINIFSCTLVIFIVYLQRYLSILSLLERT